MLNTKLDRRLDTALEDLVNTPRLPLLETREHTHGKYQDVAIIAQSLKSLMRAGKGWTHLSDIERESMDMIATKFARVLSGKPMEKQHWEDVVGYSRLVEEQCA